VSYTESYCGEGCRCQRLTAGPSRFLSHICTTYEKFKKFSHGLINSLWSRRIYATVFVSLKERYFTITCTSTRAPIFLWLKMYSCLAKVPPRATVPLPPLVFTSRCHPLQIKCIVKLCPVTNMPRKKVLPINRSRGRHSPPALSSTILASCSCTYAFITNQYSVQSSGRRCFAAGKVTAGVAVNTDSLP